MTLRVVQWATGNVGTRSLQAIIEHPDLELVGVHVYSDSKAGRDAGELCGRDPVGVTATTDLEAIVALHPDCVVYMGDRADIDAIARLLETGANVVSIRGELQPGSLDAAVADRLGAACERGGTTLYSTGSSPGFVTEVLPLALTTLERRLDRVVIDEFADMSSRDSPELLFELMGYGSDPSRFDDPRRWAHGAAAFGPSLRVLAGALGVPLDAVESSGEVAVARRDVHVAAGVIPAGTVAAQRMIVSGLRAGEPLLVFRSHWYCSADVEPAWPLQATGWHLVVDGDVPLDVTISFPIEPERYAAMTPGISAHPAVNAIPAVCAASPGIRTTVDLPRVVARLG